MFPNIVKKNENGYISINILYTNMTEIFPRPLVVFSRYKRSEIRALLMRDGLECSDDLIKDIGNYPAKSHKLRVDLCVREFQNLGEFRRFANVLELGFFAMKYAWFLGVYGDVEGYDPTMDSVGKEMRSSCTTPCIEMGDVKPRMYLRDSRCSHRRFALVVTEIMRCY
jgi:hypothetical protein